MLRRALVCAVAVTLPFIGCHSALADFDASKSWFDRLDAEERALIQADLILVGEYDRLIDGEFGPGTYRAIGGFEAKQHSPGNGILDSFERQALRDAARRRFDELGFELREDQSAGLGMYLPLKLLPTEGSLTDFVPDIGELGSGSTYMAADRGVVLATMQVPTKSASFAALYAALTKPTDGMLPNYSSIQDDTFTVSGPMRGGSYYLRFYRDGARSVGYMLFWEPKYRSVGAMLATFSASMTYTLRSGDGDGRNGREDKEAGLDPAGPEYFSGSGFFFADHGLVATNFHVAGSCSAIEVAGYGPATFIRGEKERDLAVLQLKSKRSTPFAQIRTTPPSLAEDVILLGYPLSDFLNSSLSVATGIVSSETGSASAKGWFTTNAGIQPGNSGGPLLDRSGHVIGVAVAKIDDVELLKDAGTTAPNVGFGISNIELLDFLSIFQHSQVATSMTTTGLTTQQIANEGKKFTVQIICTAAPKG